MRLMESDAKFALTYERGPVRVRVFIYSLGGSQQVTRIVTSLSLPYLRLYGRQILIERILPEEANHESLLQPTYALTIHDLHISTS